MQRVPILKFSYNYPSFEDIVPKYFHTQLQSSNMYMNKA